MKISKKDRKATEILCSNIIEHLKHDFRLSHDECIEVLMKYNSKDRVEDFGHYLYRTVLSKKGWVIEELKRA